MAGPTAEILLSQLSEEALGLWCAIVDSKSQSKRGTDFWVAPPQDTDSKEPLPFYWGPHYDDEELWIFREQPEASKVVCEHFELRPKASIGFGAGCRGLASEHVLASLAVEFLRAHNGIFLFHGLLSPSLDPNESRAWSVKPTQDKAVQFPARLGSFEGQVVAVPIDGEPAYHAVDLLFLQFWTSHQAFHLVN